MEAKPQVGPDGPGFDCGVGAGTGLKVIGVGGSGASVAGGEEGGGLMGVATGEDTDQPPKLVIGEGAS